MIPPQPGDILAVRGGGTTGKLIRLGAALRGQPNLNAHIALMHHTDTHGTHWLLEGRPGGVGWRDATDYLKSPWTITNPGQPKTDAQRAAVCKTTEAMIGTAYDWEAIAADAAGAFGLDHVWEPGWNGQVPGHVVCSSLAAYAYTKAGLGRPSQALDGRGVTPADWTTFIFTHGYQNAPKAA
jgi:hypothetical protein